MLVLFWLAGCGAASNLRSETTQPDSTASPTSAPTAAAAHTHTPVPTATPAGETVLVVTATPEPLSACAPSDLEQVDEIVIGALLPLSRPGAILSGFAMQVALNVAIEHVNVSGGIHGRPVRLITYDSAGIPNRGAHFAEQLILEDCVSAIVGIYHSNVGLAVKDVAHRYGVPVIFAETYDDEITFDHYREVFRIAPTSTMLARMDAEWLSNLGDYNGDGEMTAVFVVDNSNYGRERVEKISPYFAQHEIAFESFLVDMPTKDLSPVIARIIELEMIPDALFIRLPNSTVLDLHQQLLDAGIGPQNGSMIVTNRVALQDELFWQRVPDGLNAIVTKIGASPSTLTEVGAEFVEDYHEYFDHWPESHAFAAYDALRLAADAMARARTIDTDDIIDSLEMADIELASGRYHFPYGQHNPPDGEEVPDYMWHQWPDVPLLFLQYTAIDQPVAEMDVLWPPAYGTPTEPLNR